MSRWIGGSHELQGISSHSNVDVGETFLKILPYLSQATWMVKIIHLTISCISREKIRMKFEVYNSEKPGWFTLFFKTISSIRIQPLMGALRIALHGCTWRFVRLATSQKLPEHLNT